MGTPKPVMSVFSLHFIFLRFTHLWELQQLLGVFSCENSRLQGHQYTQIPNSQPEGAAHGIWVAMPVQFKRSSGWFPRGKALEWIVWWYSRRVWKQKWISLIKKTHRRSRECLSWRAVSPKANSQQMSLVRHGLGVMRVYLSSERLWDTELQRFQSQWAPSRFSFFNLACFHTFKKYFCV